jgi:proteasome lid subunit RPN8/RPN11
LSIAGRNFRISPGWPAVAGHDNEEVEGISVLLLPQSLQDAIAAEACAAFPRECCGLIEGRRAGDTAEALAIHSVRNLAREPDRFELDPAEHFRLMRSLRGTDREIVGCYHSHPNGRAELSPHDRAGAGEDDFLWLIAGIDANGAVSWSCHAARAGVWYEVEIAASEAQSPCA